MRVRVLFFGVLRDLMGRASEWLELPRDATVSDLLGSYRNVPRVGTFLPSVAISVNQEYAARNATLHDQDEVALLPPVSGGVTDAQLKPDGAPTRARLIEGQINTQEVIAAIQQPADGALVVFEGVVRDHSRGRRTLFLEYDAYAAMAQRELQNLADEALGRFPVRDVAIVHRTGRLEIGEASVLVVVAAAHRGPAFEACRWVIDTLKQTVPIWKKEHFSDGAVWADGEPFPPEIAGTAVSAPSAIAPSSPHEAKQ